MYFSVNIIIYHFLSQKNDVFTCTTIDINLNNFNKKNSNLVF